MNTRDFLDACKRRHQIPTDYQLSKFLGWNPRRVSMYRCAQRELDDEGCIAIAAALDLPAGYVLAEIAAARAKTAPARDAWARVARLLISGAKRTAACLLLGVFVLSQDARAMLPEPGIFCARENIHYAQCAARGRLARILRAWLHFALRRAQRLGVSLNLART